MNEMNVNLKGSYGRNAGRSDPRALTWTILKTLSLIDT